MIYGRQCWCFGWLLILIAPVTTGISPLCWQDKQNEYCAAFRVEDVFSKSKFHPSRGWYFPSPIWRKYWASQKEGNSMVVSSTTINLRKRRGHGAQRGNEMSIFENIQVFQANSFSCIIYDYKWSRQVERVATMLAVQEYKTITEERNLALKRG